VFLEEKEELSSVVIKLLKEEGFEVAVLMNNKYKIFWTI
jgi:hypothetical protein